MRLTLAIFALSIMGLSVTAFVAIMARKAFTRPTPTPRFGPNLAGECISASEKTRRSRGGWEE